MGKGGKEEEEEAKGTLVGSRERQELEVGQDLRGPPRCREEVSQLVRWLSLVEG